MVKDFSIKTYMENKPGPGGFFLQITTNFIILVENFSVKISAIQISNWASGF